MSKKSDQEKTEAIERLRKILKPGDRVYTILRHVSRSGMQRVIDVFAMSDHARTGEPIAVGDLIEFEDEDETCRAVVTLVSNPFLETEHHYISATMARKVTIEPYWIGGLVSQAIGMPWDDRHQGIKIGGCGSDMGWEIAYHLGWALWGKEWPCAGPGCPSNVHHNPGPDRNDYTPGHLHGDGGYSLRHSWL